jgi:hypothetical protein
MQIVYSDETTGLQQRHERTVIYIAKLTWYCWCTGRTKICALAAVVVSLGSSVTVVVTIADAPEDADPAVGTVADGLSIVRECCGCGPAIGEAACVRFGAAAPFAAETAPSVPPSAP